MASRWAITFVKLKKDTFAQGATLKGLGQKPRPSTYKIIGVWMWHVQADTIQADKDVCDYFSVSKDEAEIGVPLSAFLNGIYDDDRPHVVSRISRTVLSGKPFHEIYRVNHCTDGVRWIEAKGTCFRDANGRPAAYPCTIIDVTDLANEHPHTVLVETLMEAHQIAEIVKERTLAHLIEAVLLEAGRRLANVLMDNEGL